MGPGGSRGQQLTVGPWVLEASVPTEVPAVAGGQRVQLWGPVPVVPFPAGFLFFFSSVRSRGRGRWRLGVWGQQQGGPDHCPSQPPPAALTWPVTTSLAIVSQPRPEKDFSSSTQQSHFRLKELPRPCILWCAGAGRTPRMLLSRLEAARPTGEGWRDQLPWARGADRGWTSRPDRALGLPPRPTQAAFEVRPPPHLTWGFYCSMVSVTQHPPHTHQLAGQPASRKKAHHTHIHTATRLAAQTSACIPGCVRACPGSGQRPSDREASSQDWLLEVFPEFWAPPSSVASHRGSSEGLESPDVDGPLWAVFPRPAVSPERPPL